MSVRGMYVAFLVVLGVNGGGGAALAEAVIPPHALADVLAMCLRNVAAPPAQTQAYCACFVDELARSVGLETFLSFSGRGLADGENADFSALIRIAQACRHLAAAPQ